MVIGTVFLVIFCVGFIFQVLDLKSSFFHLFRSDRFLSGFHLFDYFLNIFKPVNSVVAYRVSVGKKLAVSVPIPQCDF